MDDFFEFCDEADFPVHKETKYMRKVRIPPPGTIEIAYDGIYRIQYNSERKQCDFFCRLSAGEWFEMENVQTLELISIKMDFRSMSDENLEGVDLLIDLMNQQMVKEQSPHI